MLTFEEYLVPESLHQALTLLQNEPDGSRLLAGATDTLPWARQGRAGDVAGDAFIPTIIDVSRLSELSGFDVTDSGQLRLGANVVFQEFLENPVLGEHLPHMPSCAMWFADDQIRRQATIAGNIVNASPAADAVPPLIALNATIELARLDGDKIAMRSLPVESFIEGPGRTQLQAGEIVTGIICDSLKGYGGAFAKVGQRRSLVISAVCATCCVKPSQDGKIFDDIRMALGGVGPAPMRLDDVEEFLRGKPITADVIFHAAKMPIDRVASRTRKEYRRDVVQGFTQRVILDALASCDIDVTVPGEDEKRSAHV